MDSCRSPSLRYFACVCSFLSAPGQRSVLVTVIRLPSLCLKPGSGVWVWQVESWSRPQEGQTRLCSDWIRSTPHSSQVCLMDVHQNCYQSEQFWHPSVVFGLNLFREGMCHQGETHSEAHSSDSLQCTRRAGKRGYGESGKKKRIKGKMVKNPTSL